jgi:hypothetical protein
VTQLASPAPAIAEIMKSDPSLHTMQVAFEPFLALTLTSLLRGTISQDYSATAID